MIFNFTTTAPSTASERLSSFFVSRWEEVEFAKPYFHEAGHAVMAILTGFRVEWVSMDLEFINADPIAIANQVTGKGPVCMTISSDRLTPILKQRCIRTGADRDTIVGYLMHVLAGPDAEMGLDPKSFDASPSKGDYDQINAVLSRIEPRKAGRKAIVKAASRQLELALDEHWHTIALVAARLHERRTLTGVEVRAIMSLSGMKHAA